jgi:putative ABC transport system permease protein
MRFDVVHIIKPLRRNVLSVTLIAIQVVVACAIVANLMSIVAERRVPLNVASGVDEAHTVLVHTIVSVDPKARAAARTSDLAALSRLPNVHRVALLSSGPLAGSSWSTTVKTAQEDEAGVKSDVNLFAGAPGTLSSLGMKPSQGRDFDQSEYGLLYPQSDGKRSMPATVIVTEALAKHLWGDSTAIGKRIYFSNTEIATVVGVVPQFSAASPRGIPRDQWTILLPRFSNSLSASYALRVQGPAPAYDQIRKVLIATTPETLVDSISTYAELRKEHFRSEASMIRLLMEAAAALLAVTTVGIGGLSAYWVHQRRRATGIRRTLGAKRADILWFFLAENLLIVVPASLLGGVMAWGLNRGLMRYFEVGPIPVLWIAGGCMAIVAVGLVSSLVPACQAAFLPPVEATRRRV